MAVEARKFPQEIERVFGDLPPPALAFLKTLSVKFEPFAVPLTNDPDQNDIRGFEMLAYGPGGASYDALLGQAKAAGVSEGILGVALFKVALLSAEALTREMAGQVSGQVLEKLVFTFNVNGAMLKEPRFAKTLKAIQRPAYSVLLEASEDLTPADVKGLRDALDSREKWLGLALDDSDELAHDTRVLLENRVKLVKADGKYVRKLYRDKERAPDYMLSRLLELRKDRIPFVAEGIETEAMKHYLHDRWEVNAHPELWMQGYHITLPKPWSKVLRPLGRAAKKPKAYVLPGEILPKTNRTPPASKPLPPPGDGDVEETFEESGDIQVETYDRPGGNRALLIGVANQARANPHLGPLRTVLNDVEDLSVILRDPSRCSFSDVCVLEEQDATYDRIITELNLLQFADESATVLIYFSGHGGRRGRGSKSAYLCPIDYGSAGPGTKVIPTEQFSDLLAKIRAQRVVVILDACHAGAIGEIKGEACFPPFEPGLGLALDQLAQGTGRIILSSSTGEETSVALKGHRNGLFTEYLLKGLGGEAPHTEDGLIRVLNLFHYVSEEVTKEAEKQGHAQHPILRAFTQDNFPLATCLTVKPSVSPARPASHPSPEELGTTASAQVPPATTDSSRPPSGQEPPRQNYRADSQFMGDLFGDLRTLLDKAPEISQAGADRLLDLGKPQSENARSWRKDPTLPINKVLAPATRTCLEKLGLDSAQFKATWGIAKRILGCLCLYAADDEVIAGLGNAIDAGRFHFEIAVSTQCGVEVVQARLMQVPASFEEKIASDPNGTYRIDHGLVFDESGWNRQAILDATLRAVWKKVYDEVLPDSDQLSQDKGRLKRLDKTLRLRKENNSGHFYLSIELPEGFSMRDDLGMPLKTCLPSLGVVFFRPHIQHAKAALRNEDEMVASIQEFLMIPTRLRETK